MDRYTKATMQARQRTIGSLPDVLPLPLRKTGTDDAVTLPVCATTAPNGRTSAELGGESGQQKTAFSEEKRGLSNERDGTRTRNHRIDSPVL